MGQISTFAPFITESNLVEMQGIDNKQVAEYYDKFWQHLNAVNQGGINSRHRYILYHLKKAGLRNDSNVLEIGCGLGMLTSFIGRNLSKGKITGVDISPESIAYARKTYGKSNVAFEVSDMTDFKSSESYDFIVFPDVLEHIPIEFHSNILATIRKLITPEGTVLVNIPNPHALEYFHEYKKEALQIIDQPLHTYPFLKAFYDNDFYLTSLKTYSIFHVEPEYQSLILKPNKRFHSMNEKSRLSVFIKSAWLRIMNFFL